MKQKQEWILEELSELVFNYSNQLFILLTDNQTNINNIKKDLNSIKHIKFVNVVYISSNIVGQPENPTIAGLLPYQRLVRTVDSTQSRLQTTERNNVFVGDQFPTVAVEKYNELEVF